ncbi:MAG: hypothetical protein K6T75_10655 [Acetobacteraceae bacterium]|nr:hypothetical protein [Acetobacteraceae bacterium]
MGSAGAHRLAAFGPAPEPASHIITGSEARTIPAPGPDSSDVDEVEQETLLAAVGGIGGFRGRSALFTWLCGIARQKLGDVLRRRGRDPVPVPLLPGGRGPLARLIDEAPLPDAMGACWP